MSIQELTSMEVQLVSGSGTIIGDAIQAINNISPAIMNLPSLRPIGGLLGLIPGFGPIHQFGDQLINQATQGIHNVGTILGGTVPRVSLDNHIQEEINSGVYDKRGILKYL